MTAEADQAQVKAKGRQSAALSFCVFGIRRSTRRSCRSGIVSDAKYDTIPGLQRITALASKTRVNELMAALRPGNAIKLSREVMPPAKPLKIFSGGAMRPLLRELVPLFERTHGVTANVEFQLSAALKRAIEDGATFDIAILPRPELDGLIEFGAIVRNSATDLARSTVGLAARAGMPKPDIGSVEVLRRALLQADSIAYSDGPSGAYVAALLTKLGIAAAVAAKVKLTSGPVAELVARGEAELGMQQIIAILPVAGAELVGPLPAELQNVIIYGAGVSSRAPNAKAARALLAFIRGEQAKQLLRANGLDPA
jgi:molybdate transport system substrate-binding protein